MASLQSEVSIANLDQSITIEEQKKARIGPKDRQRLKLIYDKIAPNALNKDKMHTSLSEDTLHAASAKT